jgi:pSer/pThr/pTyr-binding forkhead associated (FHA) protein
VHGRLVTVESPIPEPAVGAVFVLDSVTTLGRDVNNTIVIDDAYVSSEHAVLTYRGRGWYLEDLGSTNGTFVNGGPIEGVQVLVFGDDLQIGQVRFRLERAGR